MKFFDWLIVILFVLGFFLGSIWSKGYLIPRFFPVLVSVAVFAPGDIGSAGQGV